MPARYVFMVDYFNCKKLKQCATKKMRICFDIVGCARLTSLLGDISENLNVLKSASYTVLEDLLGARCELWRLSTLKPPVCKETTILNIIIIIIHL